MKCLFNQSLSTQVWFSFGEGVREAMVKSAKQLEELVTNKRVIVQKTESSNTLQILNRIFEIFVIKNKA